MTSLSLSAKNAAALFALLAILYGAAGQDTMQVGAPFGAPSSATSPGLAQALTSSSNLDVVASLRINCPALMPFNATGQALLEKSLNDMVPGHTLNARMITYTQVDNSTADGQIRMSLDQVALQYILAKPCCSLYEDALRSTMNAPDLFVKLLVTGYGVLPKTAPANAPLGINDTVAGGPAPASTPYVIFLVEIKTRTTALTKVVSQSREVQDLHRYVMATLLRNLLGAQGFTLVLTDSSAVSGQPSFDALLRFWTRVQMPMRDTATFGVGGPKLYAAEMQMRGYGNLTLTMLSSSVVGSISASKLPPQPPQMPVLAPANTNATRLIAKMRIIGSGIFPFTAPKQLSFLTALAYVGGVVNITNAEIMYYTENSRGVQLPSPTAMVNTNSSMPMRRRGLLQTALGAAFPSESEALDSGSFELAVDGLREAGAGSIGGGRRAVPGGGGEVPLSADAGQLRGWELHGARRRLLEQYTVDVTVGLDTAPTNKSTLDLDLGARGSEIQIVMTALGLNASDVTLTSLALRNNSNSVIPPAGTFLIDGNYVQSQQSRGLSTKWKILIPCIVIAICMFVIAKTWCMIEICRLRKRVDRHLPVAKDVNNTIPAIYNVNDGVDGRTWSVDKTKRTSFFLTGNLYDRPGPDTESSLGSRRHGLDSERTQMRPSSESVRAPWSVGYSVGSDMPASSASGDRNLVLDRKAFLDRIAGSPKSGVLSSRPTQLNSTEDSAFKNEADGVVAVVEKLRARDRERASAMAAVGEFVMKYLQEGSIFHGKYVVTQGGRVDSNAAHLMACQMEGAQVVRPVLIKLYANNADFMNEKALFEHPYCSDVMPDVFDVYDAAVVPGSPDDLCPACCVEDRPVCTMADWLKMQAGQLPEWGDQVATLFSVASILQTLHAHSTIHFDLTPQQMAWFSNPDSWRLVGCPNWSQPGVYTRSSYTLQYGAPEVVAGDLYEIAGAVADTACDMWSLGVIAWEIFTGKPLFSEEEYLEEDVVAMLLGHAPLPWEANPDAFWAAIQDADAVALVQGLLVRAAEHRLTLNQVLQSPLFAGLTTPASGANKPLWSHDFRARMTTGLDSITADLADAEQRLQSERDGDRDITKTGPEEAVTLQEGPVSDK